MSSLDQSSQRPSAFSTYRERAQQERAAYLRSLIPDPPSLPAGARRGIGVFAAAFVLATAAFWGIMLTSPPKTEAGMIASPAPANASPARQSLRP
jgi:hypothetical protein